jgi:hypothetical protein
MPLTQQSGDSGEEADMKRSYVRVIIVWLVTLIGLFTFQQYFR